MKSKVKDRLVDAALILLFLAVIGGSVYAIVRIMTKWKVEGLG